MLFSRAIWTERLRPALTPRWVTITVPGALVLGGCLFIGMLAIFFTNNLFYFLVAMILGFVAISGVLSEVSIRGLDMRRTVPASVHALAPVLVTLEISNLKTRFPSYCLHVRDETLDGEAFLLHVPPGEVGCQRYQAIFRRRGAYTFGRASIHTAFPFGFFRKWAVFEGAESIVVLPIVRDLDFMFRSQAVGSGDFRTAFRGEGTNLYSVREYRWGDSSRLIHWKSTARLMEVMIKDLEREVSGRVTLELAGGFGARLEPAVALAASLCNLLTKRQIHFAVRCGTESTVTDGGPRHLDVALRLLALYSDEPCDSRDLVGKEEHILYLAAPGTRAPAGRHLLEVGPEWDWLLDPQAAPKRRLAG
ncbi:MAG: DUF58 domain-containing protein [Candidatus Wallbacteria bacterium]|nr:DUF58 domain-containing protein [Candidatus Wallbacteria bacterium]